MRNLVIMGIQGCGKGTQAKLLASTYGLVHVSVGDIFRDKLKDGSNLATEIKEIMEAGQLVSDEIVSGIVAHRLCEEDCREGFILDGYPRNEAQAKFLLRNFGVDAVVLIEVPDDVVMKRILARRLCGDCGRDTNLIFNPPVKEGVCDHCEGPLLQRKDDNEEAIASRLNDYHTQTRPLIDEFRRQTKIFEVNGTRGVDEVQIEIRTELGLTLPV